jgi:hypothetical protein
MFSLNDVINKFIPKKEKEEIIKRKTLDNLNDYDKYLVTVKNILNIFKN